MRRVGVEPEDQRDVEEEEGLAHLSRSEFEGRMHPGAFAYESADLDTAENSLSRDATRAQSRLGLWTFYASRWLLVALVGCCAAALALGIHEGTHWSKRAVLAAADAGAARAPELAVLAYTSVSTALAAVAAVLVWRLDPAAKGTVSETLCSLNGIVVNDAMSLKTLFTTVVGMTLSTSTMAVGKEGPMMVAGAQVGSAVARLNRHLSDSETRNFVSIGLGSGIACAFGAPAGAVLFTLEKGFHFSNGLLRRLFVASMLSAFLLSVLVTGIDAGKWGEVLPSSLCHFGRFARDDFVLEDVALFVVIGVVGGLMGALFVFLNLLSIRLRRRLFKTPLRKMLEVVALAALTAVVACVMCYAMSRCKELPSQSSEDEGGDGTNSVEHLTLFCPAGQYNQMAMLFASLQESAIRFLFHAGSDVDNAVLASFIPVFFVLSAYSVGSAVPSGFFLPSLLIGAATGRLLGQLSVSAHFTADPGMAALLGAAAVLGGVSRMPVSLCVIMCEATDQTGYMLPLVISLLLSRWVGDIFTPAITHVHMKFKDYPVLEWSAPKSLRKFTAEQIMARPLVTLRRVDTIVRISEAVTATSHNGFPVVERNEGTKEGFGGTLVGIVTRAQLLDILEQARAEHVPDTDAVDLGPHARDAVTVMPFVSCTRAYNLFRVLGLRHLVVTDQRNAPIGMITRKDLYFLHESVLRNEQSMQRASIVDRITAALYGHAVHHY
eukprot:m51a1_g2990 hypothetical protein (720) ;mRNA; f:745085-747531